jgi:hypothetical protein
VKPSYQRRIDERRERREVDKQRVWEYASNAGVFTAEEAGEELGLKTVYVGQLLSELRGVFSIERRVTRSWTTNVEYEVLE